MRIDLLPLKIVSMFDNLENILLTDFPDLGINRSSGVTSLYYTDTSEYQVMLSDIVNGDLLISEEDYRYMCDVVSKIREYYANAVVYLESGNIGTEGAKIHIDYLKVFLKRYNITVVEDFDAIDDGAPVIVLNIISTPSRHKEFLKENPTRECLFLSFILEQVVSKDDASLRLLEIAQENTKHWVRVEELPYTWLFNYTPLSHGREDYFKVVEGERRLIWDFKTDGFKEGIDPSKVNIICSGVGEIIYNVFGKEDISSLVFMCIPNGMAVYQLGSRKLPESFDTQRYFERFGILSSRICEQYGIINGMDYVRCEDGCHVFDEDFLRGKNVILFDDIITQGKTAVQVSKELKKLGANVLFLVCISKTVRR